MKCIVATPGSNISLEDGCCFCSPSNLFRLRRDSLPHNMELLIFVFILMFESDAGLASGRHDLVVVRVWPEVVH